jgi:hypothetical protein
MPDLTFHVEDAKPMANAAAPLLAFRLHIEEKGGGTTPIQNIALRCQIRIEATRRRYSPAEQERLMDLFGEPARWSQTLQAMLWTHIQITVPPFAGSTTVEMPVPCSYDFNVAATKYFYGLEDGEVPLLLLFSGTIFLAGTHGGLQIEPISWKKEAPYRLPVAVWQAMMDHYYPNTAWLCLRRDVFDRLYRYKSRHALPTWESALERLLPAGAEGGTP